MPDISFDLSFRANGKLLLSGEYFVLDGAKALALPTCYGQSLKVRFNNTGNLHWVACDHDGSVWLEVVFRLTDLSVLHCSDPKAATRLQQIILQTKKLNSYFLTDRSGYTVVTDLEFPRQWGLGSSSTVISCLSGWADINPYILLENTLGGSGYDLACAESHQPIVYWREGIQPRYRSAAFSPSYKDQLYFVYLRKKQNSREGIKRYRERAFANNSVLEEVSRLSLNMEQCETIADFETMLLEHEQLVARTLQLTRAQELHFSGYHGVIKSLGAWGGDFVLATSHISEKDTRNWFNELGYSVVLNYDELIL